MNPVDAVNTDDPTTSFLSKSIAKRAPIVSVVSRSVPPTVQSQFRRRMNPQMDITNQDLHLGTNFVKMEIEKIKIYMQTTWLPQQSKQLSPEDKQQMKMLLSNHETLELPGRMEKLAAALYLVTRDENKVRNFLRLVCVLSCF